MRQRGDAGQALEKIESHPFAFEQCAGEAAYGGDPVAFFEPVAILVQDVEFFHAAASFIDRGQQRDAGQHQRGAGEEDSGSAAIRRNASL